MPKKDEKVKEEEVQESDVAVETDSVAKASDTVIDAVSEAKGEESEPAESFSDGEPEASVTSETEVDSDVPVTVQPVRFGSFEELGQTQGEQNKNLDILMDIRLQLTVELGRTELPIRKVLELTRGSIIELEKVAGEPVELYANGKLVAHGEVVVIEDNFGLRITSITDPEDRISNL